MICTVGTIKVDMAYKIIKNLIEIKKNAPIKKMPCQHQNFKKRKKKSQILKKKKKT